MRQGTYRWCSAHTEPPVEEEFTIVTATLRRWGVPPIRLYCRFRCPICGKRRPRS